MTNDNRNPKEGQKTMTYLAGFLFLFAVVSAYLGFGGAANGGEPTYQLFFFAFLMAFLATIVFSRRTPI